MHTKNDSGTNTRGDSDARIEEKEQKMHKCRNCINKNEEINYKL